MLRVRPYKEEKTKKKKKGCLKCLGAFRLLPEMRTLFCQLSPGASLVQEPSFSRLPRVTQIPSPNRAILLGSERPWTHAEYNCAAVHTHSRKWTACELKFLAASGGSLQEGPKAFPGIKTAPWPGGPSLLMALTSSQGRDNTHSELASLSYGTSSCLSPGLDHLP